MIKRLGWNKQINFMVVQTTIEPQLKMSTNAPHMRSPILKGLGTSYPGTTLPRISGKTKSTKPADT